MLTFNPKNCFLFAGIIALAFKMPHTGSWHSKFVSVGKNGSLQYAADEKGNIIPDFSRVGYFAGDKAIPDLPIVKTISPAENGNSETLIQAAIDEVSRSAPDINGYCGAILLKKGVYKIPGTIYIRSGGIVLRGEGNETKLIATGTEQESLILVSGTGNIKEQEGSRIKISDSYVPVGSFSFNLQSAKAFKKGDHLIVFRPGNLKWIQDLKMDQIENRGGTKQWQPQEYNFQFERVVTKIEGNKVFIDEPIVLALEDKYGGAEIFKYEFAGRINNVGVENLYCESEYLSDTAENHGWNAILFDKIENGWVRNVTSRYFGYSCVNLDNQAKFISVLNCNCLDAKSQITGGRRYSFNNTGQMNLFMNCATTEGRHDYVTGARVCGPNVFYNCKAKNTHADIGPHHRWAMGTLFDNIVTDGDINVQDRGNWGSGHGWAGVTQVLWNCTARTVTVQDPWVNGKNYCIGLQGKKTDGRLKGRPDGEWEGRDKAGLEPASLYIAQLNARKADRH